MVEEEEDDDDDYVDKKCMWNRRGSTGLLMKGKDRNKKYIYIQMLCLGLGPASLINLDFSILVVGESYVVHIWMHVTPSFI